MADKNDQFSFKQTRSERMKSNVKSETATTVPDFIQKLFRMLQDKSSNDIFSWDSSGTSFLVKDTNEFSKKILPQHFKHCNFASFVRQLNKYDFHKIRNSDDGQKLNGDQSWEFEHSKFQRDRTDLLEEIRRKTPGKKKRNSSSNNGSPEQSPPVTHHSLLDSTDADLRHLIQNLQVQVDDLRTSHATLEATLESMNKMDDCIMSELAEFQQNMKARDDMLKHCLRLTHTGKDEQEIKEIKAEEIEQETIPETSSSSQQTTSITAVTIPDTTITTNNNNWVDSSNAPVPLESILTDIFLPDQQQQLVTPQSSIDTASVAAAAAQMNGGSFIGSSIKTSEGLTFLALGRLSDAGKLPALPAPLADSKGKKKMAGSWTTPPRVLLVDDDSVYRDFSGRMLDRIGCNIDLANDGLEALHKMSVEKYDLILMDIMMPKMDGIATTRKIRTYDSLTPIVSMTSNFTDNDIMEYIGIGMNDILPKPFSKNTLYDILEKHCSHLKIIQQQQQLQLQLQQQQQQMPKELGPLAPQGKITTPINETPSSSGYPFPTGTSMISTAPPSSSTSSPTTPTSDPSYWVPSVKRQLVWTSSPKEVLQEHDVKRQKMNSNQFSP
ncbi:hypothetical protein K501DRAFT_210857, partial [Backusella circina FSU 941]